MGSNYAKRLPTPSCHWQWLCCLRETGGPGAQPFPGHNLQDSRLEFSEIRVPGEF